MKLAKISLLIATMNRPETLNNTINSYLKGEYVPSEIVIIDQSQTEEFALKNKQIIDNIPKEITVKCVRQEEPCLTRARNTAKTHATNEVIVCSDDDINVYFDTIKNVYELMEDKTISLIAGLDDNSPTTSSKIGYLLGTKSFKKRKIGHVTLSMLGRYPDKIIGQVETEWAMGYFFVVRKSLLDKWNIAWDETLTGYGYPEDLDFSYTYYKKSKQENLRCILTNKVSVKHLVSKEYRVPSKLSTYMYVINRAYLSYKHKMGIKSRIAMNWCNFWRLVERTLKKENPKDLKEAISLAKKNKKDIKSGNIKGLY